MQATHGGCGSASNKTPSPWLVAVAISAATSQGRLGQRLKRRAMEAVFTQQARRVSFKESGHTGCGPATESRPRDAKSVAASSSTHCACAAKLQARHMFMRPGCSMADWRAIYLGQQVLADRKKGHSPSFSGSELTDYIKKTRLRPTVHAIKPRVLPVLTAFTTQLAIAAQTRWNKPPALPSCAPGLCMVWDWPLAASG